jgi:biotin carboxyl carrier protein
MMTRYLTWVDGVEALVELRAIPDGRGSGKVVATVTHDAGDGSAPRVEEIAFERAARPGGGFVLHMPGGRVVDGRVTPGKKGHVTVTEGPARIDVRALTERDAWLSGGEGVGGDEGAITVSMPGRVVKVLVAPGDAVAAGQPVIIIEAMKMENEVKSGRAGVVHVIHVAAGDSVEADAVLMEVVDE